ncbi:MAG: class A beta-lactamase [Sandaracinobacter sp.]
MPHDDSMRLTRRSLLAGVGGLVVAGAAPAPAPSAGPATLAALEAQTADRLGFALLDTGTGALTGHRLTERFALCSTFKLFLAGLVLQAAGQGELGLHDAVPITQADLVPPSPVVEPFVGKTLSLGQLAEGAQKTSDNAAANLLMRRLGGPHGVTQRLRAIGDQVTRIDRVEPEMNLVIGKDPRDTSTPEAMAQTTARLVLGDVLKPAARAQLASWMVDTQTGLQRLRAGVPTGWTVGDKTGTGYGPGRPTRVNDVAILWPPHRAPLVAAAFLELPSSDGIGPEDEAVLASAMRLALQPFLQA